MFPETLIRAEAEYRTASAKAHAGRRGRRHGHRVVEPRSATTSTPSRLILLAGLAEEPSTIDDGASIRDREHVTV
jgi:hypothetical protein